MQEVTVRALWTYPVKSCQGVPAEALEMSPMGVVGDREFVIWEDGKLVEQKETPRVASIAAELRRDDGILRLRHDDFGVYDHEIRAEGDLRAAAWIFDAFETIDQGDAVSEWLSAILGRRVRLVSPAAPWKINFPIPQMKRVHETPKQRFFSASPVSLGNQASLEDLNERLAAPVGMDHFRVNIVVDGIGAHEEDGFELLRNDRVELLQVAQAERCVIINTDQKTGDRAGSDVLKVLGKTRRKPKEERFGSGIVFGNYMTVGRAGVLRVGDTLRVS
jgi:uncharacterized protein YcbX